MNCKFWWNETNEVNRNILSSKAKQLADNFFWIFICWNYIVRGMCKKIFCCFCKCIKIGCIFNKCFCQSIWQNCLGNTDKFDGFTHEKCLKWRGFSAKKKQMYKFLSVWFVCKQCFRDNLFCEFIIHCLLAKQYFAPTHSHFTCTFQLPFSELIPKFCFSKRNEII